MIDDSTATRIRTQTGPGPAGPAEKTWSTTDGPLSPADLDRVQTLITASPRKAGDIMLDTGLGLRQVDRALQLLKKQGRIRFGVDRRWHRVRTTQ